MFFAVLSSLVNSGAGVAVIVAMLVAALLASWGDSRRR